MEHHPNRELDSSKELRCKDCGGRFSIGAQALSASCPACGNIVYLGAEKTSLNPVEIISRRVWAQFQDSKVEIEVPQSFTRKADGNLAEELLNRYQVEWQLWVALVEHFSEAEYHAAYLSLVAKSLQFDIATERYEKHSKAMGTLHETRWQSEVCDTMLSRIRAVALVQCERELLRVRIKEEPWVRPVVLFSGFVTALILTIHFFSR